MEIDKVFSDIWKNETNIDGLKVEWNYGPREIILTSINNEGTGQRICYLKKFLINFLYHLAHGGARNPEDVYKLLNDTNEMVDNCIHLILIRMLLVAKKN